MTPLWSLTDCPRPRPVNTISCSLAISCPTIFNTPALTRSHCFGIVIQWRAAEVSPVFLGFPVWFAGVSLNLENIWDRRGLGRTDMFRSQLRKPKIIAVGTESTGLLGGSPVFRSISGVTQGNRAVTGLFVISLASKVDRSCASAEGHSQLMLRSELHAPIVWLNPKVYCQPCPK